MKTTHLRYAASRPAFTLVEIITVIAIIVALAAMTVGGLSFAQKKAKVGRTRVFVASVGQALEQYRADNGFFPFGDGLKDSTEQVYIALSGDGELQYAQDTGVAVKTNPDGEVDEGAQVYLDTLNPGNIGKSRNVKSSAAGYVIVDAWKDLNDTTQRQELYYRHDPDEDSANQDPNKMNPPSDFDLWSLGPDSEGGPTGTEEGQVDDISNWQG